MQTALTDSSVWCCVQTWILFKAALLRVWLRDRFYLLRLKFPFLCLPTCLRKLYVRVQTHNQLHWLHCPFLFLPSVERLKAERALSVPPFFKILSLVCVCGDGERPSPGYLETQMWIRVHRNLFSITHSLLPWMPAHFLIIDGWTDLLTRSIDFCLFEAARSRLMKLDVTRRIHSHHTPNWEIWRHVILQKICSLDALFLKSYFRSVSFLSFLSCLSSFWFWITELWLPNWITHQSDASVIPRRRNKWGAVASGVGPLLAGGPLTDSVTPRPPFHQKPQNEEGLGIHPGGILITFTREIRLSLARRQNQ